MTPTLTRRLARGSPTLAIQEALTTASALTTYLSRRPVGKYQVMTITTALYLSKGGPISRFANGGGIPSRPTMRYATGGATGANPAYRGYTPRDL